MISCYWEYFYLCYHDLQFIPSQKGSVLAKTYRAIHQWDHWLQQFLGHYVLEAEQALLFSLLAKQYGKHTLLIGSPRQQPLLNASVMSHHLLLSPLTSKNQMVRNVEGELYELPIASGSVDLVILPHTFELIDNPQKLLSESCRIVKPEGHIIIFGFNPYSFWGLKKFLLKSKSVPWSGNFVSSKTVTKWLGLSDFQLVKRDGLLFRPPTNHQKLFSKLKWLEWLGRKCCPSIGGVYMVMAQAKIVPLTPIKMRWKQQLSGVRATIPKPTIRSIRNSR